MPTVRINPSSLQVLKQIAKQAEEPMQTILEKAIEMYRRQWFLKKANEAYAALKENTQAWGEEIAERSVWDSTLNDGLGRDW